jgi:hypothetical protein
MSRSIYQILDFPIQVLTFGFQVGTNIVLVLVVNLSLGLVRHQLVGACQKLYESQRELTCKI